MTKVLSLETTPKFNCQWIELVWVERVRSLESRAHVHQQVRGTQVYR
eukprot:SAG31_NODE_18963_length_616_cov_1.297872_1_plen_46_part_10